MMTNERETNDREAERRDIQTTRCETDNISRIRK